METHATKKERKLAKVAMRLIMETTITKKNGNSIYDFTVETNTIKEAIKMTKRMYVFSLQRKLANVCM